MIRQLLTTDLRFEKKCGPLTPSLMRMVADQGFGGDKDSKTATGAVKCLTLYTTVAMTAEEVAEEHSVNDTMHLAMATTPSSNVKRFLTKKATGP